VFAIATSIGSKYLARKYFQFPPPENAAVLITGTSTGIGRACTVSLARLGVTVLATVRKQSDVDKWHQDYPELAENIVPIILDVSNAESIKQAVLSVDDILNDRRKQLYAVVNNAGIQSVAPVELLKESQFEHLMRTNLWGPIAVTNAFLPLLKQYTPVGLPRIVFLSTLAVYAAVPFNAIYSASKNALESVANVLRLEMKPYGINVNVIQAGGFKTDIFDKSVLGFDELEKNCGQLPVFEEYKPKLERMKILFKPPTQTLSDPSVIARDLEYVLFSRIMPLKVATSWDCAAVASAFWVLPDSVFAKIMQFITTVL
jgi:NAD(P)-dependent dehydrogenase (short-subunit alcohol dehydrogenase family)